MIENLKKTLFLLIPMLFIAGVCFGQSTIRIRGVVVDTVGNSGVPYTTIKLVAKDGTIKKSTVADVKGAYSIEIDSKNDDTLKVSAIGYHTKSLPTINLKSKDVNISLVPENNMLKGVEVSRRKNLIQQSVDKLTYAVKDDAEKKNTTTFEILRKVPLVSIGARDNLMVNGKQSYTVLLNGKPSSILNGDPAFVLGNIPADQVDKIEIITTPPSKYSQNGVTEVINIVTFQKDWVGFQASIRDVFTTLNYNSTNLVAEYKVGKWGITGYGSLYLGHPPVIDNHNRITSLNNSANELFQTGRSRYKTDATTFSPELSYGIDSLNLLLFSFSRGYQNVKSTQELSSTFLEPITDRSRTEELVVRGKNNNNNINYSFYYEHQSKRYRDRLLTFGYKYSEPTRYTIDTISQKTDAVSERSLQENKTKSSEQTLQVDYSHPVNSLTIEIGSKQIFRKNYADGAYFTYDLSSDQYLRNLMASTSLNYLQNVFTAYNAYYYQQKTWGMKAGIRYESTDLDNKQTFNNFVPNLSLQYKLKSGLINISYDREIGRPAIWQLNTFRNNVNPNFIVLGNPDLTTSALHKWELSYSLNKSNFYRLSAYYNHLKDGINGLTDLINDTTTVIKYQNIGSKRDFGFKIFANYQITKQLDLNLNGRVSHVAFSNYVDNERIDNQGTEFFITNDLTYSLRRKWRIAIYSRASNPYITTQGRTFWWVDNSLSLNRKFIDNRLNATISLDNPFTKYRRNIATTMTEDFFSTRRSQNQIRQIFVSLNYKVGGLKSQIRKNKKQIENNDVKAEPVN